jgi:hypothetical protein
MTSSRYGFIGAVAADNVVYLGKDAAARAVEVPEYTRVRQCNGGYGETGHESVI